MSGGRGYNKTVMVGNLTADPESKQTGNGTTLTTFRLAVTRAYSDPKSGGTQEDTQFFRCITWGKMAENAKRYLGRGHKVLVDGRLEIREYTDQTTKEKGHITQIVCNELVFLGGGCGEPRLGEPGSSLRGDDAALDEDVPIF